VRATDAGERLQDRVSRDAVLLQQLRTRRSSALVGDRHEQVLGADELVLEMIGFDLRFVSDQVEARRHTRLRAAVGLRQPFEQIPARACDGGGIDVHLPQQLGNDAFALLDERDEQVLGLELRIVVLLRELDRGCDGLAGLFGVLVDVQRHCLSRLPRNTKARNLFWLFRVFVFS
jgi:hypothetical protein